MPESAPAVVSTPVAAPGTTAPAPPGPAPAPAPAKPPRPGTSNTATKSYNTGPSRSAQRAASLQASAAVAAGGTVQSRSGVGQIAPTAATRQQASNPATVAPSATEAAATEAAPVAGAETTAAILEQAAGGGSLDAEPAKVAEFTEEPVASPSAPKLDDLETAKRLAKIARAESKFAADKRAFSEERAKHAANLQRAEQVEKGAEHAKRDPLGFMQRVFGVKPQDILDAVIADQTKKPEQRAAESQNDANSRIAALEEQLKKAAQETESQRVQRQASDYVSSTVAPLLAIGDEFKFVNAKFGANAAATVYNTMVERYNRTGTAPQPRQVAEFIERQLRAEASEYAKLLGVSVPATAQQAAKPKTGPTTAPPQVVSQTSPAEMRTRQRPAGKPYSSTPR